MTALILLDQFSKGAIQATLNNDHLTLIPNFLDIVIVNGDKWLMWEKITTWSPGLTLVFVIVLFLILSGVLYLKLNKKNNTLIWSWVFCVVGILGRLIDLLMFNFEVNIFKIIPLNIHTNFSKTFLLIGILLLIISKIMGIKFKNASNNF